jgi:mannose-6-phosphate isomerase
MNRPIPPAADSPRAWLRDAWSLWLEHGIDRARGGFRESLDLATLTCPADFRRLRVAARQTWVFAEACRAGVPGADAAVELGIAFLRRVARQEDGGYAQRFSLGGGVLEPTRDLYDHAFVLLALAGAARVLPPAPLRAEALALLGYLDARFAHPAGGYVESLPPALPRRQNPHMHLLEACLAAYESFSEPVFLERATALVRLYRDRLRDPVTGTLPEYFSDTLEPLREGGRHVLEPGHHCEWAWLLHWHARLTGGPAGFSELLAFVDRHGVNPVLGTLRDELWSDGQVKAAGSRLWPQTERLKSEALRPDASVERVAAAFAALDPYLASVPRGLWRERLREDGSFVPEPSPASSLYHLTCGILVASGPCGG